MSKIIYMKRIRVHLEVEKKDAIQQYECCTFGFDYNPDECTKEEIEKYFNKLCEEMKERFKEMI